MPNPNQTTANAALRHAITTMVNDDISEPGSPERARMAERLAAMEEAAVALEEEGRSAPLHANVTATTPSERIQDLELKRRALDHPPEHVITPIIHSAVHYPTS